MLINIIGNMRVRARNEARRSAQALIAYLPDHLCSGQSSDSSGMFAPETDWEGKTCWG